MPIDGISVKSRGECRDLAEISVFDRYFVLRRDFPVISAGCAVPS
ncbi:MAG: hypothetical protein ACI9UA_003032, partial [Pseudoalteromonas tetraodonis]